MAKRDETWIGLDNVPGVLRTKRDREIAFLRVSLREQERCLLRFQKPMPSTEVLIEATKELIHRLEAVRVADLVMYLRQPKAEGSSR